MDTNAIYQQQLQNQLKELNEQINDLKEKADHAPDFDSKAEYNGQIEQVHALQQAARHKLKELENTQEKSWQQQEDIETSWKKLEAEIRNLDLMFK